MKFAPNCRKYGFGEFTRWRRANANLLKADIAGSSTTSRHALAVDLEPSGPEERSN
jgi:hypothetical protein